MQFSTKLVLFLTAATAGVFAGPAVDPGVVVSSRSIQVGDNLYVGDDKVRDASLGSPTKPLYRADIFFHFFSTVCR